MENNTFSNLDKNKQNRIIEAGIEEFSQYGFAESSTNRIVKNAGISKGSLFKYFANKEEYYLFIVDLVISEYCQMNYQMKDLPSEVFERIIKAAEYEYDWWVKNPMKYRLLKGTFLENGEGIREKFATKYLNRDVEIFDNLMDEADWGKDNASKKRMINIVKWVLKGFNEEFEKKYADQDLTICKSEYIEMLKMYISDLKNLCQIHGE